MVENINGNYYSDMTKANLLYNSLPFYENAKVDIEKELSLNLIKLLANNQHPEVALGLLKFIFWNELPELSQQKDLM